MIIAGFHWFDWLVAVAGLTGLMVGWTRGIAREWPRLVMWLLILGLGRLVAPLTEELANALGLTRMGGRLCGYSWMIAVSVWVFSEISKDDTDQPKTRRRRKPQLAALCVGALIGVTRYAAVVLAVITMLSILPGGLTRFTEFRHSVLLDSLSGSYTQIYWERLCYEQEGRLNHPKLTLELEEPDAQSELEPASQPEPESAVSPEPELESELEMAVEPESEAVSEAESDPDSRPAAEEAPKPESDKAEASEPEVRTTSEPEVEEVDEPKSDVAPAPETETGSEAEGAKSPESKEPAD